MHKSNSEAFAVKTLFKYVDLIESYASRTFNEILKQVKI